jgi:hypothetical protein
MDQVEINKIMSDMQDVYKKEEEHLLKIAPRCHNRPMVLTEGDLDDGIVSSEWWECSVCGHTKSGTMKWG